MVGVINLLEFCNPRNILDSGKDNDDAHILGGLYRIIAGTHLKTADAVVNPFADHVEAFHRKLFGWTGN